MTPELRCTYSTISTRDLMVNVIPQYCIERPLDCRFWGRGANDTYEVQCADARYFLRIYRCLAYPREAINFEVEALLYLHQHGFPVAYPIARKKGGYLTQIQAPEGPRFVLLSVLAEGAIPDYDALESCQLVGESVARLHLASTGFVTQHTRPRLDLQGLLEDSMVVIRPFVAHRPDKLEFIEKVAQDARNTVLTVPEELLDTGICHGDLHGGNLHVHEGKVTHFDFEECAIGYRLYDLATWKWDCALGLDERQTRRWTAFLEGYESVRPIGKTGLSLVDTFVVIREMVELAYGIRNVQYFGHADILAGDVDDLCRRLQKILDIISSQ